MTKSDTSRLLLDANRDQYALLVNSDGLICDISGSTLKGLQLEAGDLIGQSLWSSLPHHDTPQNRLLLHKTLESGQPHFTRYQANNSWHDVACYPVADQDGQTIYAAICARDITHQHQNEEDLLHQNERFRELANNIPGWVFQLTMDRHGSFHLPYISNLPFDEETLSPQELAKNPLLISRLLHPDDQKKLIETIHISANRLQQFECEFRILPPSHHTTWLQVMATPHTQQNGSIIWNGVALDITKRKWAEEALKDSEERLTLALEATNDGIWDLNMQTGEMHFSPRYYTMLGYDAYELPQSHQTWLDLLHPDDREYAAEKKRHHLEGMRETYEAEFRLRTKDGGWCWILSRGKVISSDRQGRPLRMIGTHIDITDRKEIAAKKKIYEERIFQGQKLEAIGTLAGGIAHDFNNILSAIIGYAELIEDELPDKPETLCHINEILKAGSRARDLVKQILAFSRQAEIEKRPVQIHLIVKEALKLLRSSIPSTITLASKINPDSGLVMADPTQLHQIIMNLCTNAFHAIRGDNGTIRTTLKPVNLSSSFTENHPPLKPGKHVELTVSDTGKGIDPNIIDRIFDPFFTTKEVGKGTGLGLATVHGIITMLDGYIGVKSVPGHGSTFTVYLPAIKSQPMQDQANQHTPPTGRGQHILLVDDEQAIVQLEQQMLKRLGYRVTCLTSSLNALNSLKRHPNKYDLLLTDHTMPHLTGVQLAKEALQIRPGLPIILCTGYSEVVTEEQIVKLGIRKFIMKPIVRSVLANSLDEIFNPNI